MMLKSARQWLNRQSESTHISNLVCLASLVASLTVVLLLIISYATYHHDTALPRIALGIFCIVYFVFCLLITVKRPLLSAWMVTIFYLAISMVMFLSWGINVPFGLLVLAFVLLLSSISLGSKYILLVTSILACILALNTYLSMTHIITPDLSSLSLEPSWGDMLGYILFFGLFGLFIWVAAKKIEESFTASKRATATIKREKAILAKTLRKRTEELEKAKFDEVQQIRKFADLGQVSASTLHDLSNSLSVLSLDLANSQPENRKNDRLQIHESLSQLDYLLKNFRNYLVEKVQLEQTIDVLDLINNIIRQQQNDFQQVITELNPPNISGKLFTIGDEKLLSQVIRSLTRNALEAATQDVKPRVIITITLSKKNILVEIVNNGHRIPSHKVRDLFKPQSSVKQHGHGLGLYLAKQIIRQHFSGDIMLRETTPQTIFVLKLPSSTESLRSK